ARRARIVRPGPVGATPRRDLRPGRSVRPLLASLAGSWRRTPRGPGRLRRSRARRPARPAGPRTSPRLRPAGYPPPPRGRSLPHRPAPSRRRPQPPDPVTAASWIHLQERRDLFGGHHPVVERDRPDPELLAGLVTLPRDQQDVPWPGLPQRRSDRRSPIRFHHEGAPAPPGPRLDLGDDLQGFLGSRVVAR